MDSEESEQGSFVIKSTSDGIYSEFEKNFKLVDDHGAAEKNQSTANELSPLQHCSDGDVENCTTSSVASCSDSGICSTPQNEEEIGFEDIPLNTSDLCDGNDSSNFESSLSEKLRRMDGLDSCELEGKKTGGKFRNLFRRSNLSKSLSNIPSNVSLESLDKSASLTRVPSTKTKTVAPVLSTTGLIFENRPRNLPAKDPKEEKRHRQLYQQMIQVAKKKELRDMQEQQKKQEDQSHHEDLVVNALNIWSTMILPNWDTMRCSKKVCDLWWLGIPPSVRGKVWKLAFGNDLHITQELFEIFRGHAEQKLLNNENTRSKSKKEIASNFVTDSVVDLITMDVSRTFPSLGIFQKGGPYHNVLYTVLAAYSCYRPDIGYVQGMAFLAAVLLLNMEAIDAFICFANLINRPMQMAFFCVDQPMMRAYFLAFEVHLQEQLPKLHAHFQKQSLTPDLYLTDWIFTLYSKSLPLDVASRVWDIFCRDGDEFLFRTALGILQMFSSELMKMEFIALAQFLTKLPENLVEENLFQSISTTIVSREKFNQILTEQTQKVLQLYPAAKLKQHPTLRK